MAKYEALAIAVLNFSTLIVTLWTGRKTKKIRDDQKREHAAASASRETTEMRLEGMKNGE